MALDSGLAHRVRTILEQQVDIEERAMFGGLAFTHAGHLVCGVLDDALVARVGPDSSEAALDAPHTREMDFTGRPMRGFVFVDPPGTATDAALEDWLHRCLAFATSLPADE